VTPLFLIELPADDPERARRFWQELLQTTLDSRRPEEGHGWQGDCEGIVFGLHERGPGPGDRFSLPYFPVADPPPRSSECARSAARSSTLASAG